MSISAQNTSTNPTDEVRPIDVLWLYPRDMNIYGDTGNVLTVERRLKLQGYEPRIHAYNQNDQWPEHIDMVLGGGGQDTGQKKIGEDFQRRADDLRKLAAEGVPMLVICGLYQLFGKYFETQDGTKIEGISILDAYTVGRDVRMIGNLTETSDDFGQIVGYENHSGQTFLGKGAQPLGTVAGEGMGNNGQDHTEGARVNNVIGTYMHGSLCPKNPAIADFLIRKAAEHRYGTYEVRQTPEMAAELARIDADAHNAREAAMQRPR
ncbi:CobB/CobQ-like protein [Bifidobacterium dolichotidis]|uniref:Lipid II isoglutaminyl synthase (glutamine-hydrolyzing) subunit GatD n=1 Tax=Bifidobacterium dolichotidis TaxID=2306976 RepID=A0A430FQQ5_9BIFI|nr:glutamine amidotransferase [Bifidobacterium dolichotidis]RSX55173.1 CobB/CobQ-like protein [Bifidobacterium dolichotidis]